MVMRAMAEKAVVLEDGKPAENFQVCAVTLAKLRDQMLFLSARFSSVQGVGFDVLLLLLGLCSCLRRLQACLGRSARSVPGCSGFPGV